MGYSTSSIFDKEPRPESPLITDLRAMWEGVPTDKLLPILQVQLNGLLRYKESSLCPKNRHATQHELTLLTIALAMTEPGTLQLPPTRIPLRPLIINKFNVAANFPSATEPVPPVEPGQRPEFRRVEYSVQIVASTLGGNGLGPLALDLSHVELLSVAE